MTPSCVRRLPASFMRRSATSVGSEGERRASKRSCTAVEEVLTCWPPGPEARTKLSEISLSSIAREEVIAIIARVPSEAGSRRRVPGHGALASGRATCRRRARNGASYGSDRRIRRPARPRRANRRRGSSISRDRGGASSNSDRGSFRAAPGNGAPARSGVRPVTASSSSEATVRVKCASRNWRAFSTANAQLALERRLFAAEPSSASKACAMPSRA